MKITTVTRTTQLLGLRTWLLGWWRNCRVKDVAGGLMTRLLGWWRDCWVDDVVVGLMTWQVGQWRGVVGLMTWLIRSSLDVVRTDIRQTSECGWILALDNNTTFIHSSVIPSVETTPQLQLTPHLLSYYLLTYPRQIKQLPNHVDNYFNDQCGVASIWCQKKVTGCFTQGDCQHIVAARHFIRRSK